MSNAYKCDQCKEYREYHPQGSVSVSLDSSATVNTTVDSGTHKKSDLCGECALEIYEKIFGEDE